MCTPTFERCATVFFVLAGLCIALAQEYLLVTGESTSLAIAVMVAVVIAIPIMVFVTILRHRCTIEGPTEMFEVSMWCKTTEPDDDTSVVPPPNDCLYNHTGIQAKLVWNTMGAVGCAISIALCLLVIFPLAYQLTEDKFSIKYDVAVLLLFAPVVEGYMGTVVYTATQKMVVCATAIFFFSALGACPCTDTCTDIVFDTYEGQVMPGATPEPRFDHLVMFGIFLRWMGTIFIVLFLFGLRHVLSEQKRVNYMRVHCMSLLFYVSLGISSVFVVGAQEEMDNPIFSQSITNAVTPVILMLSILVWLLTLPTVLAGYGTYFVCVVSAIDMAVYSVVYVLCTVYALPQFVVPIIAVVVCQVFYWWKRERHTSKMEYRHAIPPPMDEQVEFEFVDNPQTGGNVNEDDNKSE